MIDILLKGKLFINENDIPRSRKTLLYILECMVHCNLEWIKTHPETPNIYRAGIEYLRDRRPRGPDGQKLEEWMLIPDIMERGGSDCKNLVAWRCAELWKNNIRCRPFIKWKKYQLDDNTDLTLFHVLIQFYPYNDNSRFEDPSKRLGMGRLEQGI